MLEEMKNIPNWTLRFINLWQTRYKSFINLRNKFDYNSSLNSIPQADRIKYCESFKKLFEAVWKVLKYRMRDNNIKCLYPREIFIQAEKLGYIKDADTMLEFIYDFNDITDISFSKNEIGNKFITKVENLYLPWVLVFQEKMQKEFYDVFENNKDF